MNELVSDLLEIISDFVKFILKNKNKLQHINLRTYE